MNRANNPKIFAECEQCHEPIYAQTLTHYGEDYVDFPGGIYIHVDCVPDYVRENRKEAVLDEFGNL